MDCILSGRFVSSRDFSLRRAGMVSRCFLAARIFGLRRSLDAPCWYQKSRRLVHTFSRGAFWQICSQRFNLYRHDETHLPQLFGACPKLRPGKCYSPTSIDKDDLLWLRNDGRTVVANPDRPNRNHLRLFGFPEKMIYFGDKGTICGNIAKFCKDWQCDVSLVIQP